MGEDDLIDMSEIRTENIDLMKTAPVPNGGIQTRTLQEDGPHNIIYTTWLFRKTLPTSCSSVLPVSFPQIQFYRELCSMKHRVRNRVETLSELMIDFTLPAL